MCGGGLRLPFKCVNPIDPSPTPWDHGTWGFYCDSCQMFFDLLQDGEVVVASGTEFLYSPEHSYEHKCGNPARYIGYDHSKV